MTKARTEAAKRRAKHARHAISLAGGATAPNPARGRDRRGTQPHGAEDATAVAMQARCRVHGASVAKDAKLHAGSVMAGCDMGLCIMHLHGAADQRARLWGVWQAVCSARRNYRMRILGTTGNPQGAAIGVIPDAMQADTGLTVDVRTADEKDAAARRADAYWTALVDALPTPQHKQALRPAMNEDSGALWRDAAPTQIGRNAVAALVFLMAMHTKD